MDTGNTPAMNKIIECGLDPSKLEFEPHDPTIQNNKRETCATLFVEKYGILPPEWMRYKMFVDAKGVVKCSEEPEECAMCKCIDKISTEFKSVIRTKNYVFKQFSCDHINYCKINRNPFEYSHPFMLLKTRGNKKNIAEEFLTINELAKLPDLTVKQVKDALLQFSRKRIPIEKIEKFISDRNPVEFSNGINS